MKPKRKIISLLLCAAMLLSFCPTSVFAEAAAQDSGVAIGASGLCEHHTEHNEDCGYTEGTPESPCTHEHKVNGGEADREGGLGHTDECHTLIKNCVHSHTEDCYPQETVSGNVATPSDAGEQEPESCGHVCSEESGCIEKELDCKHEHDEDCGYAPATEGTPCGYVCKICKLQDSGPTSGQSVQKSEGDLATPSNATVLSVEDVQKLIDELPTADELAAMSLEEQQAVYTKVQAAYEAYNALTDEQKAEVTGAEIFDSLFDVFNGMVNTLENQDSYNINEDTVKIDDSCGDNCPGHTITGSGQTTQNHIEVIGGTHNITIQGINISAKNSGFFIDDGATVNLTLIGINKLESDMSPGLLVLEGALTITEAIDGGSLEAISNGYGMAGIGGGNYVSCGTIIIESGTVTAIGGRYGAGIGSGGGTAGSTIIITGGTVIVQGGYNADDIGSGSGSTSEKIEIDFDNATVKRPDGSPAIIGKSHVADTTKWVKDDDNTHSRPCQVENCSQSHDFRTTTQTAHTLNGGNVDNSGNLLCACAENCGYTKTYTCSGISVTTDPTTMTYTEGETLDLSGLEITASFTGTAETAKIAYTDGNMSFSIGNGTTLTTAHSGQKIKVTWYGKEAETKTTLTVNAADAETPNITDQPQGATYTVGGTATPLRVTASVSDGGTLSYQWYSNTVNETTSGTAVSGVIDSGKTESTYTPPTTAEGTTYYYCVVTNTKGQKSATAASSPAEIKVSPAAPTEYTITFDGNGGTSPAAQTTTGKKLTSLPTSIRNGYSLNGWYTAKIGGDKIGLDTVFPASVTVYAQWTKDTPPQPTEYTITFDGNGGTSPAAQTTTDKTLTSLPTSIRDGYSFNGWYTATTGGDKITLDTVFTANVTVYAQWTKDTPPQPTEYTVTVNGSHTANSGAGSYEANKTVSIDAGSRSNYRFSGWTSSDGISFANAGSPSTTFVMPGKNVTVTANWTYNGGGGGGGTSYDYFTITASAGAGGSISPSGSFSVREGRDKTFTITPEGGYRISDVLVDGQSVGAVSSYTFDNVQKRHTIEAVFAKENPGTGVDNPFTDVHPGDWFYDDVMFVYGNGLMSGTSATTFEPNANTTRAQIAAIFYRLDGSPAVEGRNNYTDVEYGPGTAWYYDAATWAQQSGVMSGYGNDLFGPNDPVTRQQLAVTFYNYAKYKGYDVTAAGDLSGFTDAGEISLWAQDAMKWAVGIGLMNGKGGGILDPQGTATRAEVAAMLHNFIERNHLVPPAVAPGGDGGAGGTGNGGGGWTQRTSSPQTGDNTPIWPFATLPVSAAGLVTCTILYCKRRKEEEPACYPA